MGNTGFDRIKPYWLQYTHLLRIYIHEDMVYTIQGQISLINQYMFQRDRDYL